MEIAIFIQNIQEERGEVALHIFGNQSTNSNNDGLERKGLTERFQMTDHALEEVPTWPTVRSDRIIKVCIICLIVILQFL